jgi:hypothetical protein
MIRLLAAIGCSGCAWFCTTHYLSFSPHTSHIAYVWHSIAISWPAAMCAIVGVVMFAALGGKH